MKITGYERFLVSWRCQDLTPSNRWTTGFRGLFGFGRVPASRNGRRRWYTEVEVSIGRLKITIILHPRYYEDAR